ncbi:hypothetical protein MATL_G00219540 [Megalops atlanticus]|uniref:TNF family profile domain-containing protein n=1 Tax=Megalops atlanticus TaxID=7932 RepID=A0A9D3PL57_MEGAT|nr:hypothetical protein MATL_G00219540 [Megalops atlanticus]
MTATDMESLQSRSGTGSRQMQTCLLVSVMTLFALLLGGTVTTAVLIRHIQTELAAIKATGAAEDPSRPARYHSSEYKMQNFAYLQANSGSLENATMQFSSQSVGSGFSFDTTQHTLRPHSGGSFLLYMDLVYVSDPPRNRGSATVTVRVSGQDSTSLECRAQLRAGDSEGRVHKCWRVMQLDSRRRLVANMEVQGEAGGWRLDTRHSGLGIFLVDGSRP